MSHVQTYTIVIAHGDSIEPYEVEYAIDAAMMDVDARLFDLTKVEQSYNISINGETAYEFQGQILCPKCGEPYHETMDGSWNNDGSDACSSCYHNARRSGWNGDKLSLD